MLLYPKVQFILTCPQSYSSLKPNSEVCSWGSLTHKDECTLICFYYISSILYCNAILSYMCWQWQKWMWGIRTIGRGRNINPMDNDLFLSWHRLHLAARRTINKHQQSYLKTHFMEYNYVQRQQQRVKLKLDGQFILALYIYIVHISTIRDWT